MTPSGRVSREWGGSEGGGGSWPSEVRVSRSAGSRAGAQLRRPLATPFPRSALRNSIECCCDCAGVDSGCNSPGTGGVSAVLNATESGVTATEGRTTTTAPSGDGPSEEALARVDGAMARALLGPEPATEYGSTAGGVGGARVSLAGHVRWLRRKEERRSASPAERRDSNDAENGRATAERGAAA